MGSYKERVRQEKADLEEKTKNLQLFIESGEEFNLLPDAEKKDLSAQLNVMQHYNVILQSRINRF